MSERLKKGIEAISDEEVVILSLLHDGLKRVFNYVRQSGNTILGDGEDDPRLDHQPPPDYVVPA